jgi:hypothetical protein
MAKMKQQLTIEDVIAYGRVSTRSLDEPRVERDLFDIDELEAQNDAFYWATQDTKKEEFQPI